MQTILLVSNLPAITDPVVLDATTQPGYSNAPLIEIKRPFDYQATLQIDCGLSTVRGVILNSSYYGILLQTGGTNVIEASYIGLNPGGNAAGLQSIGIYALRSHGNIIGETNEVARNVISGNNIAAIVIDSCVSNRVIGNYLGTDHSGTFLVGNGEAVDLWVPGRGIPSPLVTRPSSFPAAPRVSPIPFEAIASSAAPACTSSSPGMV